MAKECEAAVKCRECNSDHHVSAMHPGPAPWAEGAPVTEQEQGRQSEGDISSEVTSKCTEICGKLLDLNHARKSVWLTFFPSDCPEQAERLYVVLDDQSNRSLGSLPFSSCLVSMEIRTPILTHICRNSKGNWKKSGQFHC